MRQMIVAMAVLSFLVASASTVLGKDICLKDNFGNDYVIRKPKALKPKGVIALTGIFIRSGDSKFAPFDGSATLNTAGTVAHFGVFVHTLSIGNNFTAEWIGDATFAGSGTYANTDLNGSGAISFTVEDCATVTLP